MKFHLKQIILIFQKGYFPSKSRQMIVAITFSVSSLFWEQIWIVLVKRIVLVKGANLNITIEFSIFELLLIPTFLPEQTILSFWIHFSQKGYFPPRAGQINFTIEFRIFELV